MYALLTAGLSLKIGERANTQVQLGYGSMSVKAKLETNLTQRETQYYNGWVLTIGLSL
jgi:hypothetical protein